MKLNVRDGHGAGREERRRANEETGCDEDAAHELDDPTHAGLRGERRPRVRRVPAEELLHAVE